MSVPCPPALLTEQVESGQSQFDSGHDQGRTRANESPVRHFCLYTCLAYLPDSVEFEESQPHNQGKVEHEQGRSTYLHTQMISSIFVSTSRALRFYFPRIDESQPGQIMAEVSPPIFVYLEIFSVVLPPNNWVLNPLNKADGNTFAIFGFSPRSKT